MNKEFKKGEIAYFVAGTTYFSGIIWETEYRDDGIYYSEKSNINDDIFYKDVFRTEIDALAFIKKFNDTEEKQNG